MLIIDAFDYEKNIIVDKSEAFAVRIVNMSRYLKSQMKEFDMSRQICRSGTSIAANVSEAIFAQSRPDFYSKLHIALKEAGETRYWLKTLHSTGYLTKNSLTACLPTVRKW